MADDPSEQLTRILQAAGERDDAASEILPLVYEQLRAIAQRRMMEERRDHTLEATALVHEAYLKLIGQRDVDWQSRAHFYHAAAEAMRRILIDHARKRDSLKRGGGRSRLPTGILDLAAEPDADHIVALDEAMTQLAEEDERAAEVVRLRFYAGLSVEDTADVLGISPRTVMREWSFARAWLYQLLSDEA